MSYYLEDAGEFQIQLDGRGGSGPFTLRFALDPFVDIEPGRTVQASLELPEERDRYRFPGAPKQLVEIRMVRDPGGSVAPAFVLYNPFGKEVLNEYDAYDNGYVVKSALLEDSGTFLLVASAQHWQEVGNYTIEVAIDPFVPLAIGQSASGSLSKPAQRDRYQFDGTAGQRIFVKVDRDPSGNVTPAFEIWDPFWTQVLSEYDAYDSGSVDGEYTLQHTGKYLLVVRANHETQSGGYTVLLQLR